MSQIVCKILSLLAAAAVVLCCLSGCGASDGGGKGHIPEGQKLFERGILTLNNITTGTVEVINGDVQSSYFEISGLRDKDVEDGINAEIKRMYDSLMKMERVPSYRGMAVKLRGVEGIKPQVSVSVYPEYNAGNILSAEGYSWVYYLDGAGYPLFYYARCETLNFDLATGKTLSLGDLFAPGEDYTGILSGIVDDMLLRTSFDGGREDDEYYEYEDIPMTAPFTGIKPDQKFYISTSGDISLIMDDLTPEFYLDYVPKTLTVYSDDLAGKLTLFREPSGNLYEDTGAVYNIAWNGSDKYRIGLSDEYAQTKRRPNWYDYSDVSIPKDLPAPAKAKIDEILTDKAFAPLDADEVYDGMEKQFGPDGWNMSTSTSLTCERIKYADALSVRRSWNCYTGMADGSGGYDTFSDKGYETCFLIDTQSGGLIPPEALFTDPEKMNDLLAGAIAAGLLKTCGADGEKADAVAREMVGHLSGACISSQGLILSYDITNEELYSVGEQRFGDPDNGYMYYQALTQPSYKDIGCENLTIFGGERK